jgi:hypothetical protein
MGNEEWCYTGKVEFATRAELVEVGREWKVGFMQIYMVS